MSAYLAWVHAVQARTSCPPIARWYRRRSDRRIHERQLHGLWLAEGRALLAWYVAERERLIHRQLLGYA